MQHVGKCEMCYELNMSACLSVRTMRTKNDNDGDGKGRLDRNNRQMKLIIAAVLRRSLFHIQQLNT